MSIFDRKKPLNTLKRWADRFFIKKHNGRITDIDTTQQDLKVPMTPIVESSSQETGSPIQEGVPADGISNFADNSMIADSDSDTSVKCEEAADEDKIRFDTEGSERFRMEKNDTSGGALYIKRGQELQHQVHLVVERVFSMRRMMGRFISRMMVVLNMT